MLCIGSYSYIYMQHLIQLKSKLTKCQAKMNIKANEAMSWI